MTKRIVTGNTFDCDGGYARWSVAGSGWACWVPLDCIHSQGQFVERAQGVDQSILGLSPEFDRLRAAYNGSENTFRFEARNHLTNTNVRAIAKGSMRTNHLAGNVKTIGIAPLAWIAIRATGVIADLRVVLQPVAAQLDIMGCSAEHNLCRRFESDALLECIANLA